MTDVSGYHTHVYFDPAPRVLTEHWFACTSLVASTAPGCPRCWEWRRRTAPQATG